jgi:hypothetical protein
MKRWGCLVLVLAVGGCVQSPTNTAIKKQWHKLTDQQRPSFESPADAMSLAPTPDTGTPISTDATHDCSSCPPR